MLYLTIPGLILTKTYSYQRPMVSIYSCNIPNAYLFSFQESFDLILEFSNYGLKHVVLNI